MRLSKRVQDKYRSEISRLEDSAAEYVGLYIDEMQKVAPDASVAEIREAAKDAISEALNAFGDQAGAVACEFFDQITEREGLKAESQLYTDTIDSEKVDKKVRYYARSLVEGNVPKFTKSVTDLTRFYVKRTAFENIVQNCDKNKIRYARVPSGRETCAFCFMLSSRGFVYRSELTARGRSLHGVHEHCDCIVVPGIDGVTKIEGYDPDLMYDRWKQCAETVGVDPRKANSFQYRKHIMNEVSRRDWRWLYSDDSNFASKVSVQEGAKPKKKEVDVAEVLSRYGFETFFLKPVGTEGNHTADARINGELWEMKQPVGNAKEKTIGKNTLDHQFEEATKQSRRLVLDLSVIEQYESVGYDSAAKKALDLFNGKWKDSFDELILYSEKGIRRYKNA